MRRFGFVPAIALFVAIGAALYIYNLSAIGMVGPDEPRYAWISRAMAQSGDWIIPRLWDTPWYEKPPLLYWLSGLGFIAGLNPELAPRLPVTGLALAFFCFLAWRGSELWGKSIAGYAVALLATSAGWLAYSRIAVTDLPLAVFFSTAVFLCCGEKPRPILAAAALGLAVLAKGLVPLVLFVPVVAVNARRIREYLHPLPLAVFAAIALPWFVVTGVRSKGEMFQVLFVQQTFGRFTSSALLHVQPWWFYGPVALLLLFPWFPLLPFVGRARGQDARTLAAVILFGLGFFSLAMNKLPGYLLPLLPATCVLIAFGLKSSARPGIPMGASLALLGMLPALSAVVPMALAEGLREAPIPWATVVIGIAVAAIAGLWVARLDRTFAFSITVAVAVLGFLWFERASSAGLDHSASARPIWRASHPACIADQPRTLAYGVYYYANHLLPTCQKLDPEANPVVR